MTSTEKSDAGQSAAEVKITGAPVWVHAVDEPGVFLPAP